MREEERIEIERDIKKRRRIKERNEGDKKEED